MRLGSARVKTISTSCFEVWVREFRARAAIQGQVQRWVGKDMILLWWASYFVLNVCYIDSNQRGPKLDKGRRIIYIQVFSILSIIVHKQLVVTSWNFNEHFAVDKFKAKHDSLNMGLQWHPLTERILYENAVTVYTKVISRWDELRTWKSWSMIPPLLVQIILGCLPGLSIWHSFYRGPRDEPAPTSWQ